MQGVSAVAVVDENGALQGTIGAHDVRVRLSLLFNLSTYHVTIP